ncbi:MAG: XdhC family protein [Proteobacteria bacterium]|nr:XdhC family protein [Pseudomonadota bacterium]MDA1072020.1 XdhC family protein [Pseudomonadota bacterium]
MKLDTLKALNAARAAKRAVALVTDLESGEERLLAWGEEKDTGLARHIDEAFAADRSATVEIDGRAVFINVFNPPLRLIVVGAVHIAEPLARYAAIVGYDVTIIDPRRAYTEAERFPGVTMLGDWPDDALATLAPDHRTAVVTLTHDPKIDDPALHFALRAPVFYVGCLGSRKTHGKRIDRLTAEGFSPEEIARIQGPVGLDIGARTPQEIALSIMAQVVAAHRGRLP